MWCSHCNAQLPEGSRHCPVCGKAVSAPAFTGFQPASLDLDPSAAPATPPAPRPYAAPVAPPPRPYAAPPAAPVAPPRPYAAPVAPPPAAPVKPPIPAAPGAAPAPKTSGADRRISAGKELRLLLRQGWLVMCGERRNLIISLLFPFIAAAIIIWIAGENMFVTHEDTKSACFILVCSAIWCGLFNSIQMVVKERENIKRDYVSGALRIGCYTTSRAILQLVLCLVQSAVLFLAIPGISLIYDNPLPESGLILGTPLPEYFISIFFVLMAADAMGMAISSIVKKDELAGKLAPYVLIAELLFSGTLFDMEGASSALSALMISRWGMESLGSISDANSIMPRAHLLEGGQAIPYADGKEFEATAGHLAMVLGIMVLFIVLPLLLSNIMLHRVKNDTRS